MVYIVTHKDVDIPIMDGYCILQVGAKGKKNLGFLRDDIGENISNRNSNFCELTGVYWIWKNSKEDFKGIVHYRRFFGRSNLSSSFKKIFSYEQLVNKLSKADILLPYVEFFQTNTYYQLIRSSCTDKVFSLLKKTVSELFPEYIDDFDEFFDDNKSVLFNMMFCRGEIFDDYCKWLFAILFELDKIIDFNELSDYQERIYGFLAERLLNIWVIHNKLKVENVPIINTELSLIKRIRLIRRRYTNIIKYRIKMAKK